MLLRSRGLMTAAQLAAELDVSPRTVLRDIDALSSSGVPVYSERGRNGGFALVPGYRTDLSGLTSGEAVALLSGGGRIESPAAASAKRKLEASLPAVHRSRVAAAGQRILVRPEGFVRSAEVLDAIMPVQRAVFDGRRLRVTYQRYRGEPRARVLDPIGLIVAGDTWYLVAASDGAERMYRVSRMSEVEVLDEEAQREPTVDLEAVWERHRDAFRSQFEPVDVVIDCATDDIGRIGGPVEVVSTGPSDAADGRVRARLRIGDGGWAARVLWTMLFDVTFEVVEPDWVREMLQGKAGLAVGGAHQSADGAHAGAAE